MAEEPDFPAELEQALAEDGASGCALVEDGELRGYIVAAPQTFTNTGLVWMLARFAGFALKGRRRAHARPLRARGGSLVREGTRDTACTSGSKLGRSTPGSGSAPARRP